jgi:hypothetical protein
MISRAELLAALEAGQLLRSKLLRARPAFFREI